MVLGAPDANTAFTKHLDSEWDMSQGVMHCKRIEVPLVDSGALQGAPEMPFTPIQCNRAGVMQGAQFDIEHWDKPWRFRKHACPVPIVDGNSGQVVDWKIPECSTENGTVICENDTVI